MVYPWIIGAIYVVVWFVLKIIPNTDGGGSSLGNG